MPVVAWLDCGDRVLFRVGAVGQPASLTGTAWLGCGPVRHAEHRQTPRSRLPPPI
jgi:hypothetical protein